MRMPSRLQAPTRQQPHVTCNLISGGPAVAGQVTFSLSKLRRLRIFSLPSHAGGSIHNLTHRLTGIDKLKSESWLVATGEWQSASLDSGLLTGDRLSTRLTFNGPYQVFRAG